MKKAIILFQFVVFLPFLFAENESFIKIESAKTIIGNDYFKAKLKKFTGISGEENEEKIKYYRKEHTVELSDYSIKKYLITYGEYQLFLNETSYKTLYEKERKASYMKQIKIIDYPVKRISFIDAVAYCQWYSDKNGKNYRLPTSAEWEYAALNGEKKIFPWGNESKILPSTNTDSIVGRENYTIYQIEEDESTWGMKNLMGGGEYTLDCYDDRFYENSPAINPVCLIPYNAPCCVMRGITEYNNLENNVYGLYDFKWNGIANYNGYSYFRIVQADDTVFNKGTIDEAYYCPMIGKASMVKIFKHPKNDIDFSLYKVDSDIYILFKSKDSQYYRCFFQTYEEDEIFGGISKNWKFGWINKDEIKISSKKWYN